MAFEVFKQTIRDKWLGAVLFAVILFFLIFWVASIYPTVKPMMDTYNQMLTNPAFKAIVGDLTSVQGLSGFLSSEVFSYMGIVLGAYIAYHTASFAAGEIEQKSSELMLSLPVSRVHVLLSRFAVLLPITVALTLAMLLAVVAGARYDGESIDVVRFADGLIFMLAFMLAVGGGSLLLSALMSNGRNAAFASIGILLAMFLVDNIGSMVTSIDWARQLSLFHYAKMSDIVADPTAAISWANLGILLVVAAVFLALAVIAYNHRDINVT